MSAKEVLLIGASGEEPALGRWPVIQRAGPHVTVVQAPAAEVAELARHARLAMARTADGVRLVGDEAALEDLDEGAALFVRAWRERPHGEQRPAEGLPWDAPGYEAP